MSNLKEDPSMVLFDAMVFAREGENPSNAIYAQEKRGAEKVKQFSMIPSRTNGGVPRIVLDTGITLDMRNSRDYSKISEIQLANNRKWTRKQYENMGIICEEVPDDDMFIKATLPDGWAINNTDHSMWNNVTDEKGRIRFTFFYKAAFYDRDAFTNFNTRFSVTTEYVLPKGVKDVYEEVPYEKRKTLQKFACVKDSDGTVLFQTDPVNQKGDYLDDENALAPCVEACKKWLEEKYPNYEDFSAYWDYEVN